MNITQTSKLVSFWLRHNPANGFFECDVYCEFVFDILATLNFYFWSIKCNGQRLVLHMKYLAILILAFCSVTSMFCQTSYTKLYSSPIFLGSACQGDILEGTVELSSIGNQPIRIYDLASELCEIEYYANGQKLSAKDTLTVPGRNNLKIQFKFKYYDSDDKIINYSTPFEKCNQVELKTGSYYVSHEDLRSGNLKYIDLRNNCSDSIKVYFAKGGTVTSVSVHCSETDERVQKFTTFGLGGGDQYIRFSRYEMCKYYLRYSACHWSAKLWLQLENL